MLVTDLVYVHDIPHELVDHHGIRELLLQDVLGQVLLRGLLQLQALQVGGAVVSDDHHLFIGGLLILLGFLKFISDLGDVHAALVFVANELIIFFVFSEYIIGEFDVTAVSSCVLGSRAPSSYPWSFGHRRINLLESEFALNPFFINIRNHIGWLNKGHGERGLEEELRTIRHGLISDEVKARAKALLDREGLEHQVTLVLEEGLIRLWFAFLIL